MQFIPSTMAAAAASGLSPLQLQVKEKHLVYWMFTKTSKSAQHLNQTEDFCYAESFGLDELGVNGPSQGVEVG